MNKRTGLAGKLLGAVGIFAITLLAGCTPSSSSVSAVCHATGDPARPYEALLVANADLESYAAAHPDDILQVQAAAGLASPLTQVAPEGTSQGTDGKKVTICHATGSTTNAYNQITVSVNGFNGHDKHSGDIIPARAGGCPTTKP